MLIASVILADTRYSGVTVLREQTSRVVREAGRAAGDPKARTPFGAAR
jgi:hypothetical protein